MNDEPGGQAATPWEWACAAVGSAVTLATLGFLLYEGVAQPRDGMAELMVEVDSVVPLRHGWAVAVEAHNRGSATAASVRIVGELRDAGGTLETSEMTLDYVPERSSRTGALLFSRDPAGLALSVRPTGYARP